MYDANIAVRVPKSGERELENQDRAEPRGWREFCTTARCSLALRSWIPHPVKQVEFGWRLVLCSYSSKGPRFRCSFHQGYAYASIMQLTLLNCRGLIWAICIITLGYMFSFAFNDRINLLLVFLLISRMHLSVHTIFLKTVVNACES